MVKIYNNRMHITYFDDKYSYHRENGPAIEYISGHQKGYKAWYINGLRHREDGPAKMWSNKYANDYYFKGKLYATIRSDEQWIKFVKILKLLQ